MSIPFNFLQKITINDSGRLITDSYLFGNEKLNLSSAITSGEFSARHLAAESLSFNSYSPHSGSANNKLNYSDTAQVILKLSSGQTNSFFADPINLSLNLSSGINKNIFNDNINFNFQTAEAKCSGIFLDNINFSLQTATGKFSDTLFVDSVNFGFNINKTSTTQMIFDELTFENEGITGEVQGFFADEISAVTVFTATVSKK